MRAPSAPGLIRGSIELWLRLRTCSLFRLSYLIFVKEVNTLRLILQNTLHASFGSSHGSNMKGCSVIIIAEEVPQMNLNINSSYSNLEKGFDKYKERN